MTIALCLCGCVKSPEEIEADRISILASVAADVTQAVRDKDGKALVNACDLAILHPKLMAMRVDIGDRCIHLTGLHAPLLLSADELKARGADPNNQKDQIGREYVRREQAIVLDQRVVGTLTGLFDKWNLSYEPDREPVTVVRQGQSKVIKATVGIVLEKGFGSYTPMSDAQINLIIRDCRWLASRGLSVDGEAPTAKLGKVKYGCDMPGGIINTAEGALLYIHCTVRVSADCPTDTRWVALVLPGLSTVAEASSAFPALRYTKAAITLTPATQMSDGLALAAARLDVRPAK